MNSSAKVPFHDSLYRLAHVGNAAGVQLVRLTGLSGGNRYTARPVEFADDDTTQYAGDQTIAVTNLAEPADTAGTIPAGTDAVAIDVEGRWVVFIRPATTSAGSGAFAAKVVSALGLAAYSVLEQSATDAGALADNSGAAQLTAHNLAELSIGPGAAVTPGTVIMVFTMTDIHGIARCFFDHPTYAKYLD